jgi:5-methylcytosine-specific restriction endonuclease McrA
MRRRTKVYSPADRKVIFEKTQGVCHFCGDPLIFEKYDLRDEGETGAWNIDHVNQRWRGGAESIENCLPACVSCNSSRWGDTGEKLREFIALGRIAAKEIKKDTALGKQLKELQRKQIEYKRKRRKVKEIISEKIN